MSDASPMDPTDNPRDTDHLPVSGEVDPHKVQHDHDPILHDTNDVVDPDMIAPEDSMA